MYRFYIFTPWTLVLYILQVKNSNRRTHPNTANTFEQRRTCVGTREKNRRLF